MRRATALGNDGPGVAILSDAAGNTIGGTIAAAGNVIAGNTGAGVSVIGSAVGNQITANHIFSNKGLGIAPGTSSTPNPNHGDTPATGPNNLLNAPVITSAGYGSFTTVTVSFVSLPDRPYRLDFYASPTSGSSGENWLGSVTLTTGANGQLAQATTFSLKLPTARGSWITATATDQAGDTSEFSNALQLVTVAKAPLTITMVNLVYKRQAVSQVTIVFSGPVDFAVPADLENYQLIMAGKNNSFATNEGAETDPLEIRRIQRGQRYRQAHSAEAVCADQENRALGYGATASGPLRRPACEHELVDRKRRRYRKQEVERS